MFSFLSNVRLVPLTVPIALVLAAAAVLLVSSTTAPERAFAATPDISGVSCADVYQLTLEEPVSGATTYTVGTAPKVGIANLPFSITDPQPVAISLTRNVHNTTAQTTEAVTVTYNIGIPGVIAGVLSVPQTVRCASVDKAVATVTSAPTQTDPITVSITPTASNPPKVGMPVFWNSTNGAQRGFYNVTAVTASTATLERLIDGICNNEPAGVSAPGTLHACVPNNKGVVEAALAFPNTDVTKDNVLGEPARPTNSETGTFNKTTNIGSTVDCGLSTGVQEGAAQGRWTRTDVDTKINKDPSDKTPSYGIATLNNPTAVKTCNNVVSPTETKASANLTVVWSLDSAEREGAIANWDSDWDKDGCLDYNELNSPSPAYQTTGTGTFTGGRDPFNPYDCGRNLTGTYNILVEADPITLVTNQVVPGAFFRCKSILEHNKTTNAVSATIFCYTDNPLLTVNPEDEGGSNTCGPTPVLRCGDGLTGSPYPIGSAPPPSRDDTDPAPPDEADDVYGDVDDPHVVLTGSYDKVNDTIDLSGCFDNVENGALGPNVFVKTAPDIDALTGHGTVDIWLNRADCTDPGATTPSIIAANIQIGKTADKDNYDEYDSDLDGCSDRKELTNASEALGGLRDPYNPWDLYDVDGSQNVDLFNDIFGVAFQFGTPGDDSTNRGPPLTGSVGPWNLHGPDATVDLFNDIFGVAFQFGHNCN